MFGFEFLYFFHSGILGLFAGHERERIGGWPGLFVLFPPQRFLSHLSPQTSAVIVHTNHGKGRWAFLQIVRCLMLFLIIISDEELD